MFNFQNLFVFDLANNHQGDIQHASKIIRELGSVVSKNNVKAAMKLQFRDLDTFIHENEIDNEENSNIKRFLSTKLDWDEYQILKDEISENDMITMCTPFDEKSVKKIIEMKFEIIKVASCSAKDWPLLEEISKSGLPTIISTGGLSLNDIDNIVSFFDHKGVDFALMHCISIYPTPSDEMQLGFLKTLKDRYPKVEIGWSTHEHPNDYDVIKIAYSIGAKIFERHVGLSNEKISLNKYSSTPRQIEEWIQSFFKTKSIIGSENKIVSDNEIKSLSNLKRGIYFKNDLKKNQVIKENDIFFAIPYHESQFESGEWSKGLILKKDVVKNEPLIKELVDVKDKKPSQILKKSIHLVKALLNEARVRLNPEFEAEFSHHMGVESFDKIGATIINCINREYCKKIIIQTPGQFHPTHYHKKKEETFHLLHGDLELTLDDITRKLTPGEICLVMPGVWHSFKTINGCVFEEISTTHFKNDSVYKDPIINKMKLTDMRVTL